MEFAIFLAALVIGLVPAHIASEKGKNFFLWWLYGTLLFIVAVFHAILLPPTEEKQLASGMKKCPYCAEVIRGEAVVCRYCGRDLPPQQVPPSVGEPAAEQASGENESSGGKPGEDSRDPDSRPSLQEEGGDQLPPPPAAETEAEGETAINGLPPARKVKTGAILITAVALTAAACLAGWFYFLPSWQLHQAKAAAASGNTGTAIPLYETIRGRFPGSAAARQALVEELKVRQAVGLRVTPLIEEGIAQYGSDIEVACALVEALKKRYQDNLEPEIRRCYEEGKPDDRTIGMVKIEAGFLRSIKEKCSSGFYLGGGASILTAYEDFLQHYTNDIPAPSVVAQPSTGPDAIQPPTTMEEVTGAATDWAPKIIHSKLAYFSDTQAHYSILALTEEQEYPYLTYINRLCVCQYDTQVKKWRAVWESDSLEGQSPWEPLLVLGPDKSTLLCSSYFLDGAKGSISVIVLTVQGDSRVTVKESGSVGQGSVELDGSTITVAEEGMGQRKYSLRDGRVEVKAIRRSGMASQGAVQARFAIRGNNIVPVSSPTLTIKVGQTIAFVPADKKTAREFDERQTISIYTDAWNGPPLTVCEANRLKTENYYTFQSAGEFHFYLEYRADSPIYPKPTFTIVVKE